MQGRAFGSPAKGNKRVIGRLEKSPLQGLSAIVGVAEKLANCPAPDLHWQSLSAFCADATCATICSPFPRHSVLHSQLWTPSTLAFRPWRRAVICRARCLHQAKRAAKPRKPSLYLYCAYTIPRFQGFSGVFQGHLRGSAGQFRPFEAARWAITCHPERFQFQPIQASMNKAIELRPDRDMLRTFASRVLSSGQALQMSLTRQARHIADAGRFGYDS